ncbi:Ephrin_rec_like domain-containing protein, partial [Durusdinium trenchii]
MILGRLALGPYRTASAGGVCHLLLWALCLGRMEPSLLECQAPWAASYVGAELLPRFCWARSWRTHWSNWQWTGRVQSFTFFLYRFRMDRWWFGLLVLMRIPLISLCVVLATDFPMAQACLTTLILSSYLVLQSWKQPWKAPILNWVDTFCSTVLLQISGVAGLGISLQEGESFAETFTLLLLVALFSGLILMVVALTVAVLQQCSMGQAQQRFLRLLEGSSDGMADRLEETNHREMVGA